jgi:hypothetical protein
MGRTIELYDVDIDICSDFIGRYYHVDFPFALLNSRNARSLLPAGFVLLMHVSPFLCSVPRFFFDHRVGTTST